MADPIGKTDEEKLLKRAKRLVNWVELQAPPIFVCRESVLIRQCLERIYGDAMLAAAEFDLDSSEFDEMGLDLRGRG